MFTCKTCGHADFAHKMSIGFCLHNNGFTSKNPTDIKRCVCVGMDKPFPDEEQP